MTVIPKIRPSMRTSWRKCPRAFFFSWVAGLEPARGRRALVIGTAYHAGLEAWRASGDPEVGAGTARARYRQLCDAERLDIDPAAMVQVGVYVLGYAKRFRLFDGTAVVVEAKVFDDGDPEGGTADCVMRTPDGKVWLVEDKTTSRFDDEGAMRLALRRNDQVTTYVAALARRGLKVEGCLYRQVLKTGTSITKKETPEAYEERLTGIYCGDEAALKYRELRLEWTPSELAAVRGESQALNRVIRRAARRPLERWPSNPLSCIGPFGPCEFIKLCASGKDAARDFKPRQEGPLDHGKYRDQIWSSAQAIPDASADHSLVPGWLEGGSGG